MMLVYDCEILKAIPGNKEPLIEGISYCKGWSDFVGMGISCIGAYDYKEYRYRMFLEDNFKDFQELLNSRNILVGFNSVGFDNRLITASGFTIPESMEQYDILVEVKKADGSGKYDKGYKLDDLSRLNFGTTKSGFGGNAPIEWQHGEVGKVIDYCLNDVTLTVQLFNRILSKQELKSPKNGKMLKMRLPGM